MSEHTLNVAGKQVGLSFLMSVGFTPPLPQVVRSEIMRVFTAYWNHELPLGRLEAELKASGVSLASFDLNCFLNTEDLH